MFLNPNVRFGGDFSDLIPDNHYVSPQTIAAAEQNDDGSFVRGGVRVTPATGGFVPPPLPESATTKIPESKGILSNPILLVVAVVIVVYLVLRS